MEFQHLTRSQVQDNIYAESSIYYKESLLNTKENSLV